jgi:hypothetical protein
VRNADTMGCPIQITIAASGIGGPFGKNILEKIAVLCNMIDDRRGSQSPSRRIINCCPIKSSFFDI